VKLRRKRNVPKKGRKREGKLEKVKKNDKI